MSAADDLYEAAAARVRRLTPAETVEAVRRGALLIDLRPTEYRWREGEVSGAIPVPRHVLEWRLDPYSEYRMPELTGPDQEVVLMCSEGYSSALSADLAQRELGLRNVADLKGGFAAWKEAGLPWISHAPHQLRRA
jgi:rhodanese-related sulfurtransferase